MQSSLLFLPVYFFEVLVLRLYCRELFHRKFNKWLHRMVLAFGAVLLWAASHSSWQLLNIICFFSMCFCYIKYFYQTDLKSAVFHASGITIMMETAEWIADYSYHSFLYGAVLNRINFSLNLSVFLASITGKVIFLIFLLITVFLLKKKGPFIKINWSVCTELFLLPAIVLSILVILIRISDTCILDNTSSNLISFCAISLLLMTLLMYQVYTELAMSSKKMIGIKEQIQRNKYMTDYHRMLLQKQTERNILIHDIRKHLYAVKILNESGKFREIEAYLNDLLNERALVSIIRSDSDLLNAILNAYSDQCHQKGIRFETDIRASSLTMLADMDMVSIFCNILDNAVSACETIPDAFIDLKVIFNRDTKRTTISMQNSYSPESHPTQRFKPSADDHEHGYGLKSVEQTVGKYNGYLETYGSENQTVYHTIIILNFTRGNRE